MKEMLKWAYTQKGTDRETDREERQRHTDVSILLSTSYLSGLDIYLF